MEILSILQVDNVRLKKQPVTDAFSNKIIWFAVAKSNTQKDYILVLIKMFDSISITAIDYDQLT